MRGINKAIILGNLGADPQSIIFQNGGIIANLSIATSEVWTDQKGNQQENTQWNKVRLSGKLAEIGLRLLAKGSQVYIEGSIKTRKWVDKNNQTQYTIEIYAEKMEIISGFKNPIINNEWNNADEIKKQENVINANDVAPQDSKSNLSQDEDPNWIPF